MLACKTELHSPAWRQGMIDALTSGCSLADYAGLRGGCLYHALLHRFTHLAPVAYRRYLRAHALVGNIDRIYPKRLSFWQWRTCSYDLVERISLSSMLGCAMGEQPVQLRSSLLLTGEENEAASHTQVAYGHACGPPDETDGQIDGYELCCRLMYDERLDGDGFVGAVIEYLDAFWPEDYRRYRYRYAQLARQARIAQTLSGADGLGLRLEYRHWSALVCQLQDEIRRSRCAGVKSSSKRRELSRQLLCQPSEPPPVLDWTAPPLLLGTDRSC